LQYARHQHKVPPNISQTAIHLMKTGTHSLFETLNHILTLSRPPILFETLRAQMRLAMNEATEGEFIPDEIRDMLQSS